MTDDEPVPSGLSERYRVNRYLAAGFTVGELQAIVLGFAVAGAYDRQRPYDNPVWHGVAVEAEDALKTAAHADDI